MPPGSSTAIDGLRRFLATAEPIGVAMREAEQAVVAASAPPKAR